MEYQHRRDTTATKLATDEVLNFLKAKLAP
jgi:hypothetical protein